MTLYTIKERRGTAAAWAMANTLLEEGQVAFEKDTGKFKLGDGVTHYNSLPYFIPEDQIADLIATATGPRIINNQSGTAYTLALADAGAWINLTASASVTLTIPDEFTVNIPIGRTVEGCRIGAAAMLIDPGPGVIIHSNPGLYVDQFGVFGITKIDSDVWVAYGRLHA